MSVRVTVTKAGITVPGEKTDIFGSHKVGFKAVLLNTGNYFLHDPVREGGANGVSMRML